MPRVIYKYSHTARHAMHLKLDCGHWIWIKQKHHSARRMVRTEYECEQCEAEQFAAPCVRNAA